MTEQFELPGARALTDEIRRQLVGASELICWAYETRAWASLGSKSWEELLDQRIAELEAGAPERVR